MSLPRTASCLLLVLTADVLAPAKVVSSTQSHGHIPVHNKESLTIAGVETNHDQDDSPMDIQTPQTSSDHRGEQSPRALRAEVGPGLTAQANLDALASILPPGATSDPELLSQYLQLLQRLLDLQVPADQWPDVIAALNDQVEAAKKAAAAESTATEHAAHQRVAEERLAAEYGTVHKAVDENLSRGNAEAQHIADERFAAERVAAQRAAEGRVVSEHVAALRAPLINGPAGERQKKARAFHTPDRPSKIKPRSATPRERSRSPPRVVRGSPDYGPQARQRSPSRKSSPSIEADKILLNDTPKWTGHDRSLPDGSIKST